MPQDQQVMKNYVRPTDFVDVLSIEPNTLVCLAYATDQNFIGEIIDGYRANRALLTKPAAIALSKVVQELQPVGYALKILDAYRPQRAVDHFIAWSRDPTDSYTKAIYYPHLKKADLFEQGYLFEHSSHSRGSTVDLTLVNLASGKEVDMGSPFDFFDEISWMETDRISAQHQKNRQLLRTAMTSQGFEAIATEWWHFTLKNEPYPETYFNFPIE